MVLSVIDFRYTLAQALCTHCSIRSRKMGTFKANGIQREAVEGEFTRLLIVERAFLNPENAQPSS